MGNPLGFTFRDGHPVFDRDGEDSYRVYNMRLRFTLASDQPTVCPRCGGHLSMSSSEPSVDVQRYLDHGTFPVHYFTLIFVCEVCGWWAIRELFADYEFPNECDYLVVCSEPTPIQANHRAEEGNEKPWTRALADPRLYSGGNQPPPDDLVRIFKINTVEYRR